MLHNFNFLRRCCNCLLFSKDRTESLPVGKEEEQIELPIIVCQVRHRKNILDYAIDINKEKTVKMFNHCVRSRVLQELYVDVCYHRSQSQILV